MASRDTEILAIVQARVGSSRLPGKVLRDVAGKPLLQYVLERLRRCRELCGLMVATSTRAADDPIAELCESLCVDVYRGAETDVAGRFLGVLDARAPDAFVRISGDSPLLDPGLVDRAVVHYCGGAYDLVTNLMPRTYPRGQSVEVVSADVFRNCYAAMSRPEHFEHVTAWFYENEGRLRIANLRDSRDHSDVRLVVDTVDDLRTMARIIDRFTRPHWEYELDDIVEIYESLLIGLGASGA